MGKITILANGQKLDGWLSASVSASVERPARGFSVVASDAQARFLEKGGLALGDAVRVLVDGLPVLTGRAEKYDETEGGSGHTLTVQGRSLTGSLVDCTDMSAPGQWRRMPLLDVARSLCEPFGISVSLDGEDRIVDSFDVDVGATVYDSIEELCRMFGLLAVDDAGGNLRLALPGQRRAGGALEGRVEQAGRRGNILDWQRSSDGSQRFSRYEVRGQQAGSSRIAGTRRAESKGIAIDPHVRGYRPKVIIAEAAADSTWAQKRAEWEMAQALGQGESVSLTVTGWRQGSGDLWEPGLLVPVHIVRYGVVKIDQEMVIADLDWSLSDSGGAVTKMTLRDPAAYMPAPEAPALPAKAGAAAKKAGGDPWGALRADASS